MRTSFASLFVALVAISPLLGAVACGGDGASSPEVEPGSTSVAGSTQSEDSSGDTSSSSGAFTSSSSTNGADGSSSETTAVTGVDPTTGPPPPPKLCSLEAVDPLADPSVVVMGDEEGMLPVVVGEALLRNCGCHYSDDPDVAVDYMSDAVQIATWQDFHVPFVGVFPMNYEDRMVWEATRVRVVDQMPLPMPAIECGVEGEDGVITAADRALFEAWFDAEAPDGANFEWP